MAIDVRRREFVGGLGGVLFGLPLAANAQQPKRARKVGILMPLAETDPESQRRIAALLQMLRQFGWVDGKTIVIETRFANGNPASLPTLASELVRAKVDVIVTQAAQPVEAVRAATTTIPIVMASVGDAWGAGYVASLAHPGGNITGLTLVATDQSTKRLQLIKELLPTILRIAVLSNANAAGHRLQLKEMEPSAATLGLSLLSLPVQKADDGGHPPSAPPLMAIRSTSAFWAPRTHRDRIPRIFHGLTCTVRESFGAIATSKGAAKSQINRDVVAASPWGRAGRA